MSHKRANFPPASDINAFKIEICPILVGYATFMGCVMISCVMHIYILYPLLYIHLLLYSVSKHRLLYGLEAGVVAIGLLWISATVFFVLAVAVPFSS